MIEEPPKNLGPWLVNWSEVISKGRKLRAAMECLPRLSDDMDDLARRLYKGYHPEHPDWILINDLVGPDLLRKAGEPWALNPRLLISVLVERYHPVEVVVKRRLIDIASHDDGCVLGNEVLVSGYRADLAAWKDGKSIALEIKTEYDYILDRTKRQLMNAIASFDYVVVVCDRSKTRRVLALAPSECAIVEYSFNPDGSFDFELVRNGRESGGSSACPLVDEWRQRWSNFKQRMAYTLTIDSPFMFSNDLDPTYFDLARGVGPDINPLWRPHRFRRLLRERGFKLDAELATLIGFSAYTIRTWCTVGCPATAMLPRIANALGMDPDSFVKLCVAGYNLL